jgi:predicted N-acetyltransferase YhbS
MAVAFRPYFDSDFLRIRDFLSANAREADGSPTRRPWNWWIDRWNFTPTVSCTMHDTSHEQWAAGIGLWQSSGTIAGLVLHEGEGRGEAFIASGPEELPEDVLAEMLSFIDRRAETINLRIDPRFPLREELARACGYVPTGNAEPLCWLEAESAPSPRLPDGFRLVEGREIPFCEKGLLHARSFGYADDAALLPVSARAFERLPLAPDYRPDLDLVALDADGTPACMVGLWYDRCNSWGILEPVGTNAAYRKRGLAKALIGEGMRRLARLAAREGSRFDGLWVGSDQPFYLAVGFRVANRWPIWRKPV